MEVLEARLADLEVQLRERDRRTEAASRRRSLLELALNALPHPFYIIDVHDYTIQLANTAAGVGRSTRGMTCYALTHKLDHPCPPDGHPCPLQQVLQSREPTIVEHRHFDAAGRLADVEVHAFPVFDAEGEVAQMIEFCIDITRRKVAERTREETIGALERALADVKTLSGLLPICASCKKIRDDRGEWNPIETYIHERSDADFSHSICPECQKKLYGHLDGVKNP